jgi:hypothetical protein
MQRYYVIFDDEHVWGFGESEEEAVKDGREWYENADENFDADYASNKLTLAECDHAVILEIETKGGNGLKLVKNMEGMAVLSVPKGISFH